jgi:hypothetical protein
MPGLVHFRAPARFMALFVLSAALLAGLALSRIQMCCARRGVGILLSILLALLVGVELGASSEYLPHADATASRAYTDLRPATAHLVAATHAAEGRRRPPARFLSMSKMLFDPGDKTEIETVYGAVLSPDALWAYWVAAKAREVLAPNLSLAFGVPAVDGYDGGLLPMSHYVQFSRLLLPEGTLDGRLRENLVTIPDARWLSLLGVRFLITDKTGDAWVDGVFYDRQFQPVLDADMTLSLGWLPKAFDANALGLLYQGAGEVWVTLGNGEVVRFSLALATAAASDAEDHQTPIRLRWSDPAPPLHITLRATSGLTLTGASLIDERTGAFYPLVLSENFRLVHSGDVKIYENLPGRRPLPRAFWVQHCITASDADTLLAQMRAETFDPLTQVARLVPESAPNRVEACMPTQEGFRERGRVQGHVQIVTYEPHRVVMDVHAPSPGVVVLTDAWYPGWQCEVTSLAAASITPVLHPDPWLADLLFRAVSLPAGSWRVTYTYNAGSLLYGVVGTGVGVGLGLAYIAFLHRYE